MALQIAHNRDDRGLQGVIFTRDDRAGEGKLSSRLGLVTEAVEAPEGMDLYAHLVDQLSKGGKADYVIVDDLVLDVFAFGITTDFRTKLFPGSQRLIELADRLEQLQVEVFCRRHHRKRMTSAAAHAGALSPDVLPVNHA
ncbi:hypothetical protein [Streptomyces sp. NPDC091371]|uniref:hypothetical protein n=1 Tax=Streptomyces sp. NPDC091371 TaxID=3155303 RepID=UPI00343B8BDE